MSTDSNSMVIDLTEDAVQTDADEIALDAAEGEAADVVDEQSDPAEALPKGARKNADGTVTLTLRYPKELTIKSDRGVRTEKKTELTFHRLNGGDIRAIQAASRESQVDVMLARSTKLKQVVVRALFDKMDASDCADAIKVVEGFFGGSGPTTGR